ncbi:MAG: GH1 family beta-glucosidase [Granulosicoccus sp.]
MSNFTGTEALRFPKGFIFGAATAAYQIEGAASEDGRTRSIWDTFSHEPGRVKGGDTGDVACNHYHRWAEDLDILASLGAQAYRFSIAWSRIFPDASGRLNDPGLDFYDRLIDGCIERGLKAFPTLYHWDMPQWLFNQGGWQNPDSARLFAHYAHCVAERLGDRVEALTTFNEPWCSAVLGHLYGIHAPGVRDLGQALTVAHGQHVAHGLAVQSIRQVRPSLPTGITLNVHAIKPATESEDDSKAAERQKDFHNRLYLDPLFEGQYPASIIEELSHYLPDKWEDDLPTINQPLDFWGLNYYTPMYVEHDANASSAFPNARVFDPPDVPRTDFGWQIQPEAFSDLLLELNKRYALPPCYITENGAAYNDQPVNGVVADQRRISYMDSHLQQLRRAMDMDVNVKGYFAWSLMDNFEWAEGYSMRFGLVHVDFQTQDRTLKNSAHWYREMIAFQN